MAKLTVVVPVYNVEEYIAKCLDSLLAQTFKDFEVFVVNDGSPDGSQVIIDEYAKKDERILPIKKENGGYGSVLKYAIDNMRTDYFLVCDPDDWLAPDALKKLVHLQEKNNADLVIGAKYLVYSDDAEETYDLSYNKNYATIEPEKAILKHNLEFNDLFYVAPSPHAKLYKRELAKTIDFPSRVSYTDNTLYYLSLLHANCVVYTDEALAYYLIDRVGNTATDVRPKVIHNFVTVFESILEQAKDISEVPTIFYYRMFESFKYIMYKTDSVDCDQSEYVSLNMETYKLVTLLKPYKKEILTFYKKLSTTRILEKMKDVSILSPNGIKTFEKWVVKRAKRRYQG